MEQAIFKATIVGAGPAGLIAAYELSKQTTELGKVPALAS